ncbi:MAG: ferritin-like domain-containing protein, partial [Eggerthellaceae bacterium]|nr:ferritin-like domain-containing protein [Eggerthellaceae bacterium]
NLNKMTIGADVPAQLDADLDLETETVKRYNKAIALAGEVLDYATRDMLQEILVEEDAHVDGIEEMQDQIEQMSLQIFLSTQS